MRSSLSRDGWSGGRGPRPWGAASRTVDGARMSRRWVEGGAARLLHLVFSPWDIALGRIAVDQPRVVE